MKTYLIPLVPGPTRIAPEVLAAFNTDYGSSDIEKDFYELYEDSQKKMQEILNTKNKIALMTGEAMVALWAGLKSCLIPGDKVLSIGTGVYGYAISQMAHTIGCEVEEVGFGYDEIADPNKIEDAIKRFHPKMVTMVHCETPSGTLNPVAEVGQLVKQHSVPLFYVDAVASAGGAEVRVDDWGIDICVSGSHKCLSAPANIGIVSVSERSWKIIDFVEYKGYDALATWEDALENHWFPYTPPWHSIAAINIACQLILDEGLENVYQRHQKAAEYCRTRLQEMGLSLYPAKPEYSSPTVTAVKVPKELRWDFINNKLRKRGMVVGGSLGKLATKVFRIGHMGSQANLDLLEHGMDLLEYVILSQ